MKAIQSKVYTVKFTHYPKLKGERLIEMRRARMLYALEHSRFCADLFTEDSFQQDLTARSLLGLSLIVSPVDFKLFTAGGSIRTQTLGTNFSAVFVTELYNWTH